MKERKMNTVRYRRQRKFLAVLPLIVLPFLTFLLWSLGLIGDTAAVAQSSDVKGFNMKLPEAVAGKDSTWNKLQFYEEADKDSAKYRSLLKSDPNYNLSFQDIIDSGSKGSESGEDELSGGLSDAYHYDPYPPGLQGTQDPNEEKVYRKISQLNAALRTNEKVGSGNTLDDLSQPYRSGNNSALNAADIDRLEGMMNTMQDNGEAANPEMTQIGSVLDKILDIQHPERIKSQLQKESLAKKGQVFTVVNKSDTPKVSLLAASENKTGVGSTLPIQLEQQNRFYSLENTQRDDPATTSAIAAFIPLAQTLVSGATVKLQLLDDIYINGILIEGGQFLYGVAGLTGERLTIHITGVRYKENILPVDLSVYDLDGLEGIYVPGAITRDVAKQSSDQAIQSISLATLNPSLGAQAADAGLQAAKSLIGKKVKTVKVTIPSGYRVLLYDNKQRDR